LDPGLGEDIVQDAFEAVLQGLVTERGGRHPRGSDVEDPKAFINYLGGVINSLVSYERAKRRYNFDHDSIDIPPIDDCEAQLTFDIQSPDCVEQEAGWNDLQEVFFTLLQSRATPQIRPILHHWELEWRWSPQIPVPIPKRRFRRTIRCLAKEALRELGEELAA